MNLNTHPENRKDMVKAISELTELPSAYMGMPSAAFQIGPITVNRDGTIDCEDETMIETIKPMLIEHDWLDAEAEPETSAEAPDDSKELPEDTEPIRVAQMDITMPLENWTVGQLTNLLRMIYSKQYLINRMLDYLRESRTLNGSNRQPYLCEVTKCHFVEFSGCTLDANGITYDSVYARSSHVFLYNCGLYNALQGLECYLAQGNVKDCCGSCSWAMVSYASLIIASGTVPAGSRGTGENGLLYANSVTTDYGTAIPTVTPDETGILYATTTKSWRGSWRTDTLDVIQGVYYDSGYNSSLNWNRGCMWFSNAQNLLSGCTVKSATLTLHRKTGSGSSSAKSVYLCAITNTSASGTPSIARNYGAIGTIGRDKQVTFSIPVDAVQGLADGYYGGLCLYETPYNFGSSTYSNAYMRMSGTDTNYEPYIECVFSGSTAVG